MTREIVTSENREEYNEKKMAEKDGSEEKMKDPQMYKYYSTKAESLSSKASTNMEHYDAYNAHENAAMYAKPHPKHKEHEEKARHHAKQMRIAKKVETERHIAGYMENRDKAQVKSLKKKGVLAKDE